MFAQLWKTRRSAGVSAATAIGFAAALLMVGVTSGLADDEEPLKIAPPQHMTLETKDGLELRCTYYPGGVIQTKDGDTTVFEEIEGKKVVPIIMLHGWKGQRREYSPLAVHLQHQGHAVMVPDLRGHGESKTHQALDKELDLEKMGKVELLQMVQFDVEAAKDFLMDKNNEGELNIESLCVIGAGAGSIVAMNWAVKDWSYRQFINRKIGRDVKALILLSPVSSFKGTSTAQPMRSGLISGRGGLMTLDMMIIVGKGETSAFRDAKKMHSTIERTRPKIDKKWTAEERRDKQSLFIVEPNTELQGTALLDPRLRLGAEASIRGFIHYKLVQRQDKYPWQNRHKD